MITYERIILELQKFAKTHKQINEFGNGDLWELAQNNKLADFTFPLLWVQDNGFNVSDNNGTFSFNILAIDQVLNGEVNENFVKSNMLQILIDLMAYFRRVSFTDAGGNPLFFKASKSANFNSFTERFEPSLTGWSGTFNFNIFINYDKCTIPLIS